ncbi:MAG: hypothetical protein Q9195_005032, partial [Heterodermia aff. obscurata]
ETFTIMAELFHNGEINSNMRSHGHQSFSDGDPCMTASSSTIAPRAIHAGDAYYIGDIYEKSRIRSTFSEKNRKPGSSTAYLNHLDYLTDNGWPQLRYLADFMRVTASPPNWRFLSPEEIQERACRTKAVLFVFHPDRVQMLDINTIQQLQHALDQMPGIDDAIEFPPHLFVVEDLSRDVIECLGTHLDVDPMLFRGHISDYVWYNIRDPWIELPDLDIVHRQRSCFSIRYAQTRYFRDEEGLRKARAETGRFNVLRRVDRNGNWETGPDLPSSNIGTVRSKMSFWVQPRKSKASKNVVAILLVDPSVTGGYPIWGGYNNIIPCPSIYQDRCKKRSRGSMLSETVYWLENLSVDEINSIPRDPRILCWKPLSIVCSEWIVLLRYANTRFSQLEWEVEDPDLRHKGEGLALTLENLHSWRRRFPIYKNIISEAMEKIIRREDFLYSTWNSLRVLEKDFEVLLSNLDDLHSRAERMMSVVTAVLTIEESQKALQQNRSLGRLTYLAALFVPMSFISSFFSMNEDITRLDKTFWIYFAVALPVTLMALFVTRYSHNLAKILQSLIQRLNEKFHGLKDVGRMH